MNAISWALIGQRRAATLIEHDVELRLFAPESTLLRACCAVGCIQNSKYLKVQDHQSRRIASRSWRELIKQVWKVDPLQRL